MGKGEELLVAQRNPIMGQFPAQKQKQISKLSNLNNGQSPRSKEQKHFLDENHIQHDEKSASNALYQNGKYQNNHFQTQSRKPLQDITNVSNSKQSSKKSFANETQAIKQTRHFTYLTFLNSSALKQFKVLLYVDRELGIPHEYVDKLQDHSIDNDVATDDEQIISATRKLKSALEEEVYMNRDLEEDLLEQIMYEEIEKWESEEDIRKQEQKQQSLIDYEMLMKNQQIVDTKHKFSIDQLYERIYIKYQSKCKKPFTIKSHERLLYKTIEKTVPKFKEYFKNQSYQYKQYLQKKQQKNLKQQQQQQVQQQQQSQIQQQQQIQLQLQQQQQQQQQMQLQQQVQNEHNSNYVKQKKSSSSSNSMMEQISNVSTQPSHISENSYINLNQCNLNEITTKVHGSNSNNFEVLSDVSSLHKISSSNLIDSV